MRTSRQTWIIRSSSDFGRTIADLRALRGITQSDLAAQSGLPREYLARLERGLTVTMLERMLRLLRRLGAEVTVSIPTGDDDA
ncbi:MAG: helix-turn-helix domain-containing protein [Gaiellaceae bacterium]